MNKGSKITFTVIIIIVASLIFGFAYDALMTVSERHSYPLMYKDEVTKAHNKHPDVPERVIYAIIKIESDFDHTVHSDKNAYGLMQITAASYEHMTGETATDEILSSLTPEQNIEIGTKYLSYLFSHLENWDTVYAAYNAGIGKLTVGSEDELAWLKNPEYSDDGKTLKYIPYAETRNYVRAVKNAENAYLRLYK